VLLHLLLYYVYLFDYTCLKTTGKGKAFFPNATVFSRGFCARKNLSRRKLRRQDSIFTPTPSNEVQEKENATERIQKSCHPQGQRRRKITPK
jgi:hypothetical protein